MRVMRLNPILTAPPPPRLPELRAVIRQDRLRMPLLFLKQSRHLPGSRFVAKLLSQHQEPAVVVDAYEEPVPLALNGERPLEVDLPQLIGLLRPEEPPALILAWVPVQSVPCEDVVYGFPGQADSLYAAHCLQDEAWEPEEALLYARCSPLERVSQREDR